MHPSFSQFPSRWAAVVLCFSCSFSLAAQEPQSWTVPAPERIPVAFVVSEGAVMIDFAGPWEVFQDVMIPSRGTKMSDQHLFRLYTVSSNKNPVRVSGGMRIIPDYTFEDAPQPRIVVIPAQSGDSVAMISWIKAMTAKSDVVMSVCNGAFVLAKSGALSGKAATAHHQSLKILQESFPDLRVQSGMRWVEGGPGLFTSGGLSSGIDLALHVVDRYLGREVALATAKDLEYESTGWMGTGKAKGSSPPAGRGGPTP